MVIDPTSANFDHSKNNSSVLKDPITVYSPSKHNSTAAICLLVRNETLYIDEFMDFHISLGFNKVYLYDNSMTDDLDLHLWYSKRKDIQKYVQIIHFPQAPAQHAAYLQCLRHDAANETFVALIDIDEFVVLKKHDNTVDFMEEHCSEDCGQISLNWNTLTVSNETNYRPVPTLMRNIHSYQIWGTIKVIVRPSYVDTDRFDWGHSVRLKKGNWVDTTGKVIPRPNNWKKQANNGGPSDVGLLYHYRFRSPGEFYHKNCIRGDVLHSRGEQPKCTINRPGTRVDQGMYGGNLDTLAWELLKKMVPKYAIFEKYTNATMKTLYMDYPYRF
eukprot:CAMPEP_0113401028 /NCGR_PEP_ID=MMETSP0013_2-20120614/16457_1 /TAXON_ID=2843 ORGANISM="Skeletonema costatum, Strain 1716" /NCGR_SAMPLE_ID=MMETSP0013_2 /ASSEMBLY_ACC=CAM_ASM_000158 /LENGTH=328 /DNA_ID=CAMNT_0000286175 /DNA_START=37 /DNA_END=1023 /DNA_ORIENTATION=+ /assembly_acc=CAM_ASM_000158